MAGGSSLLVIAGIWTAILGYAVLYTGVQKLNNQPDYKLGMALRGTPPKPATATGTGGPPRSQQVRNAGWQQYSMLPAVPL